MPDHVCKSIAAACSRWQQRRRRRLPAAPQRRQQADIAPSIVLLWNYPRRISFIISLHRFEPRWVRGMYLPSGSKRLLRPGAAPMLHQTLA